MPLKYIFMNNTNAWDIIMFKLSSSFNLIFEIAFRLHSRNEFANIFFY
jgi:hypothetical protein